MSKEIHMKEKIAILLPTCGGFQEETTVSIASMSMYCISRGIHVDIINQSVSGVAKCRNELVKLILGKGYSRVLWIDSDMYVPMNLAERLIAHDLDIVGSTYTGRAHPVVLLGHPTRQEDTQATSGLVEFSSMPGGVMMVKPSVYEAIPRPWYFESYERRGTKAQQFLESIRDAIGAEIPGEALYGMLQSPALADWLNNGSHAPHGLTYECSEDINFLRKARRYGYSAYCDLDITPEILHVGKYAYGIKDLIARIEKEADNEEESRL